jgi:hypothetical protein
MFMKLYDVLQYNNMLAYPGNHSGSPQWFNIEVLCEIR